MKEDSIKSFRTAFDSFLKKEHLDSTYQQKKLITNWSVIMGKTIADRTEQVFFKGKILFVKLSSAPLRQEMLNSKDKVIALIAREIGEGVVEELRLI